MDSIQFINFYHDNSSLMIITTLLYCPLCSFHFDITTGAFIA